MARTPTLPPTEPTMWRKLLARTHPDAGGSHELFIWTNALRETVVETEKVVVRRNENGQEISPGLRLYRPGERVLAEPEPNREPPGPEAGLGPLDTPPPPPVRLVGRRKVELR